MATGPHRPCERPSSGLRQEAPPSLPGPAAACRRRDRSGFEPLAPHQSPDPAPPAPPILVVANTGPVIARPALGVLFEPFQRLQGRTASDGFGLGLAIVSSITTAHHGTVTAEPRPRGGLTVTVTIPRLTG